jgi:hypothetical protein
VSAVADFDYAVPADRPTITVGDLLDLLAGFDRSLPITAYTDAVEYVNIVGASRPDDGPSLILETADTFDTRQW